MELTEKDLELLLRKLQPKIGAVLSQTNSNYREDLEQDLKEMVIRKIKEEKIDKNVPGFFEYLSERGYPIN